MATADEGDIDLLNETQDDHTRRIYALDQENQVLRRRLLTLETKAGVISTGQEPVQRQALFAEGDQEEPEHLTVEDLGSWDVPMAAGFDGPRPVMSEPMAAGFDGGRVASGALVNPRQAIGDIASEILRRQQQVDVDGKPYDVRDLVPY
jgi:hypothetical protein